MVGSSTCRSTMSWRISGSSVFEVSLAPPCSPDENRLCIPERSNSSAFRDSVRWGDIDFLCSLPCGFVEKDEGSDLLIEFLLRPQRPLLDTRPLIHPLAARSFQPRHLPLPFAQTTITSSVPDSLNVCKDSREF